jgi:hypothetical protein
MFLKVFVVVFVDFDTKRDGFEESIRCRNRGFYFGVPLLVLRIDEFGQVDESKSANGKQ